MAKKNSFPILNEFTRFGPADKDKLSELVVRAKGPAIALSQFAKKCEVNPSTLSRIVNKKNVGNSSDVLILKIAENADPNSGITLDLLMEAHGMKRINSGMDKDTRNALYYKCLEDTRAIFINELMKRKYSINLPAERTSYNAFEHNFRANFEVRTNALNGNDDTLWLFEMWPDVAKPTATIIRKKILMILGLYYLSEIQADKFSFVVYNEKLFIELTNSLKGYTYPNSFSVIYVDIRNNEVVAEENLSDTFNIEKEVFYKVNKNSYDEMEDLDIDEDS